MEFGAIFLLKPAVYFGVLFAGARLLPTPGQPTAYFGRLGLVALGRLILGATLGTGAVLFTVDLVDGGRTTVLAVLAVLGFALWFAAARVAFGPLPLKRLLLFAVAAEAVSLGMNYLMLEDAQNLRFC